MGKGPAKTLQVRLNFNSAKHRSLFVPLRQIGNSFALYLIN